MYRADTRPSRQRKARARVCDARLVLLVVGCGGGDGCGGVIGVVMVVEVWLGWW